MAAGKKVDRKAVASLRSVQTAGKKPRWKKPVLEDVSGKVMAQPYIRFT